jgi:hypothetical protein
MPIHVVELEAARFATALAGRVHVGAACAVSLPNRSTPGRPQAKPRTGGVKALQGAGKQPEDQLRVTSLSFQLPSRLAASGP